MKTYQRRIKKLDQSVKIQKKENLAESVEERKVIEEEYVEETEKRRGKQFLVSSLISFVILLLPPNYDRERF